MRASSSMQTLHPREAETVLAIVAAELQSFFPDDCYKRCAYAAFALVALLREKGFEAQIIGGDFAAFVMSEDGRDAVVQGFALGAEQCAHFWVESCNRLIDVGPYFLPRDARFRAAAMPALAWQRRDPLPRALRYRALQHFPRDAQLSQDPHVEARCAAFIAQCRLRCDHHPRTEFPTWVATGSGSLNVAEQRGDPWARGARRFEKVAQLNRLPF